MNQFLTRICISGFIAVLLSLQNFVFAAHNHSVGSAAPIGIMDSHLHAEGEWMVSYSMMQMAMKDNLDGTDRAATPLPGYMASPLSMDMKMHMLGVMYGLSEEITLMGMLPVQSLSMDHEVNMNGQLFTTESSGLGDVSLSMLIKATDHWTGKAGLIIPTGSIDETDVIPSSSENAVQLPYPMQLGSGSVDVTAGITHLNNTGQNSWGTQVSVIVRLSDNDRDYRLGNQVELNSWLSYGLSPQTSASIRVKLQSWGNISGADASLNVAAVPTADPELRAGTRADLLFGFNYKAHSSVLFGLEVGTPVYQKLDGPQLELDLIVQLGVQISL